MSYNHTNKRVFLCLLFTLPTCSNAIDLGISGELMFFDYEEVDPLGNSLNREKGLIPGLSEKEYEKDPVHLIADELLGIQIAQYIAGSRALFEFERFDKKKPGILKRLPPIMDDVIGGLIAGVLVKVCS